MRIHLFAVILIFMIAGCSSETPQTVHLPSKNYNYIDLDMSALPIQKTVYVPIYSDIYHSSDARRFLLTVTLSVRNTSLRDTMYVANVDYYDSAGNLQRQYLRKTILLKPLESVEFVVEHKEDVGGAGANFIVTWATESNSLTPVIQAVMIGTASQQGISFVTEGIVIQENINTEITQ